MLIYQRVLSITIPFFDDLLIFVNTRDTRWISRENKNEAINTRVLLNKGSGHFYGGSPDPIPTMKIAGCHLSKWSRTHM